MTSGYSWRHSASSSLGMDNIGAMATFEGDGLFTMTLNAVADTIAETFTKVLRRLLALNGLDTRGSPGAQPGG